MITWREMTAGDISPVMQVAEQVHQAFPERREVMAQRQAWYPAGCLMAEDGAGRVAGYAITHPGIWMRPPALDALLTVLPDGGQEDACYYLHDIALLPSCRNQGGGKVLLPRLTSLARAEGFSRMGLTAVHGSAPYWQRYGFQPVQADRALQDKLASYGAEACYMGLSVS